MGDEPSAQHKESERKQDNYNHLVAEDPAHKMEHSPTRKTINDWIDTWGKDPNKLAYVYLQNAKGDYGYFVIKGLPVSYCAALTPPDRVDSSSNGKVTRPAPGMDGVYYSGGQCSSYYAMDASTGAYLEWSVGANQSYFLYDQPLNLPQFKSATPMGPTTIEKAKTLKQ
jgi:hypothetical protein